MNVAIYARVSTHEQNPDMQLSELRDYAKRRGFTVFKEYVDHVTGNVDARKKKKRVPDPGYRALMKDAHLKLFECVMVWKYDRLARSLSALIEALNTFDSLKINFISCTQEVDTTTPAGRLFFHMVACFAEFERDIINERTRAGIANARAMGVTLGRPRQPELEQKVLKLRKDGLSLRRIAETVGMSNAGVLKVIRRAEREAEQERLKTP